MAKHNILGKEGEKIAIEYLTQKGYAILEHNWCFRKTEIDIIGSFNNKIIFIEVKSRSSSNFGEPYMAVNKTKQKNLIITANAYILEKDIMLDAQFDIISIVISNNNTHIEHFENAFYPTL